MSKFYFVEIGILWENEETPDTTNPYVVYDGQYGYYDEDQYFVKNFNRAKEEITKYVEDGVNSTYGIISEVIGNFDDIISAEGIPNLGQYNHNAVVYSLRKENNKIIENFIKKEGE